MRGIKYGVNEFGMSTSMSKVAPAEVPIFDKGRTDCRVVFAVDPTKSQYVRLPPESLSTVLGTDHPDNRNITGFKITTTTGSNLFHATLGYMGEKDKFHPIHTAHPVHIVNTQKSTTAGATAHHLAGPGVSVSEHVVVPTADQLRFATMHEKGSPEAVSSAIARIFSSPTQASRQISTLTGVKKLDDNHVLITSDPLQTVAKRASENSGYLKGDFYGRKPVTVGSHTGFKVTTTECNLLEKEYNDFSKPKHPHDGRDMAVMLVPVHTTGAKITCPSTIEIQFKRNAFEPSGYKPGDHLSKHT